MDARWLILTALTLTTLIYLSGVRGPFFFDDLPWLVSNSLIHIDGTKFEDWRLAAMSSSAGPGGRPVSMLSFALNHVLAGDLSAKHIKVTNVFIHLAIGYLIFLFSLSVSQQLWPGTQSDRLRIFAIAVASIWLLHPLHVSTVLYSIQRMAQLSTLFAVLALQLFMRYRTCWAERGASAHEIVAAGLWLSLCWGASFFSKENGIILPWLLLVLEVFLFRGQWHGTSNRLLRNCARGVFALLCLIFLMLLFLPPTSLASMYMSRDFSLEERMMTQIRVLWYYLGWIAFPDVTAMSFQHDYIRVASGFFDPLTTMVAFLGWIALAGLAVMLRSNFPLLGFGITFFLIGHLVESSIVPLEMVYEHRNYLPSIAVVMCMASPVVILKDRISINLTISLLVAFVLVIAAALWSRVDVWSDEIQLNGVNVNNHPSSSRSHYFYADSLLRQYRESVRRGDPPEVSKDLLMLSRYHFEQMYLLNPNDLAAIVMLYYVDSNYFPALNEREQWLDRLESVASFRILQASDFNALESIVDCHVQGACPSISSDLFQVLATLETRYPESLRVTSLKLKLMAHVGAGDSALREVIESALLISPGDRGFLYEKIILDSKSGDIASMYESAEAWLRYDKKRSSLGQLEFLFTK
tara:strand:+ start:5187 stop:7100 length:1914 start_codon:yes stop_codon:yes gene_type:complete